MTNLASKKTKKTEPVSKNILYLKEKTVNIIFSTLFITFFFVLYHQNKRIKNLIASIEKEKEKQIPSDEESFKKEIESKYLTLFVKEKDNLISVLKDKAKENEKLIKEKDKEFKDYLKEKYEEAVEQIKFTEIEYKRTITKKRRQYNRMNSHKAKPQKTCRDINEV